MKAKKLLLRAKGAMGVIPNSLIRIEAELKRPLSSSYQDVIGFGVLIKWDDVCFKFFTACPPLKGTTQAYLYTHPTGHSEFKNFDVDYKDAITIFHKCNLGKKFSSIALFKPNVLPEPTEAFWYIRSDSGKEIMIGSETGIVKLSNQKETIASRV